MLVQHFNFRCKLPFSNVCLSTKYDSSYRITLKPQGILHLLTGHVRVVFCTLAESSSLKVPRGHSTGFVVPCGQ